jgi:hypothetical protein
MKKYLLLGTGAVLGYVAGAKAGTKRYQQIVEFAKSLAESTGLVSRRNR